MTSQALTIGVCLIALLFLVRLVRGHASVSNFNYRRARSDVRSATGQNAAALFAVVELSQLVLNIDKLERHAAAAPLIAVLLAVTALAFVLALAVVGRRASVLMSIAGLSGGLVNAYAENGSTGVLLLLVATALFLWLFGLGRGVLRSK